jgi:hypothetical protein
MHRGDELLSIDGVDAVNANTQAEVDKLNDALSPSTAGQEHTFRMRDTAGEYQIKLVSAEITSDPVQTVQTLTTPSGEVGYILFNDHIATAEASLVDAVTTLKSAGVVDLVLDMRYNGGGYIDIASQLAYMIAGPSRTTGQTFERLTFNDKNPTTDPVTGESLTPTPFHATTQGFSLPGNLALPTLNLSRVFILTGPDTCSASESVINGLRGVDVEVIQIGQTTCGKPYGFYPQDNCGTTYFSIQFEGVNAKEFGGYTDGFSPQNTPSYARNGTSGQGCWVADDLLNALGNPQENMLSTALSYRSSSTCPAVPATQVNGSGMSKPNAGQLFEGRLIRPQWRENRLVRKAH